LEYAQHLKNIDLKLVDHLFLVMRVYFEKSRSDAGWKGFINDPQLDDSFDIESGLYRARQLLVQINEIGVPSAKEMFDPISPQYSADLITWASIGARTIESQTLRQMSSGLSMPIGFKISTDGSLDAAINAMKTARRSHSFLGIDQNGRTCIVQTKGYPYGHLILRGGRSGPNYSPECVRRASEKLKENGLEPGIMVDCSHGNSDKTAYNQEMVLKRVLDQRIAGNDSIVGLMLESNLFEGNQKLGDDPSQLRYGVSITDECIGWDKTEELMHYAHRVLSID
jgi:3-deoxy-7-phosphoheptulonate synthase